MTDSFVKTSFSNRGAWLGWICLVLGLGQGEALRAEKVQFNRDIRPLFSETCFHCHGPDSKTRKAGLRLDEPKGLFGETKSGVVNIVPGKPEESELYLRIVHSDADEKMPPEESGKVLTQEQIQLIERWIREGADYQGHWAFIPPQQPPVPKVEPAEWGRNEVDAFVLKGMQEHQLQPSPEADARTLARRVTMDLTGLPPSVEEVQAFLEDGSDEAYEHLVDRLLNSEAYGERMAQDWMDAARYADTHGYHIDSQRDMWLWRDWVIRSFNDNKPYDEFTVEQLAGDLIPGATQDQVIASGFNRNHMINFEGGAIPDEYHMAYVVDRVKTTSTVWLGLTLGCAQCHDHKYDPISQKEFFQFYAFFNNVDENGLDGSRGNAVPMMPVASEEYSREREKLVGQIGRVKALLAAPLESVDQDQGDWEARVTALLNEESDAKNQVEWGSWWTLGPLTAESGGKAFDQDFGVPAKGIDLEQSVKVGESQVSWVQRADWKDGETKSLEGDGVAATFLYRRVKAVEPVEIGLSLGSDDALRLWVNGGEKLAENVQRGVAADQNKVTVSLKQGENEILLKIVNYGGGYGYYFNPSKGPVLPETLVAALKADPASRTAEQRKLLQRHYRDQVSQDSQILSWKAELADGEARLKDLDSRVPTTMVMKERANLRETFIMARGQYDQPTEKVSPGVPAMLPSLPEGFEANRMALAQWLVSDSHPLTARVTVNRLWQMVFGTGIVETSEDFGLQGQWPTHPELLDWLATEFIQSGWDVKRMIRLLVTSSTYRQQSKVSPERLAVDPKNYWLARGSRFRLKGEFIRDLALEVSGLLNPVVGGPSVKPYQPAGLWKELAHQLDNSRFTAQVFEQDHGPRLYRRSLYTFWKRSVPPPNMLTFDAPNRELCTVRRSRTNTPLQALVLMNDPIFVEAARVFAQRVLSEAGLLVSDEDKLRYMVERTLARLPKPGEMAVLKEALAYQRASFAGQVDEAKLLLTVGEYPNTVPSVDPAEVAAWTMVANILLNLDEAITRN